MVEDEDVAENVPATLLLGELVRCDGAFSCKKALFLDEGDQYNTFPVRALAFQIDAEVLGVEVDDGRRWRGHELLHIITTPLRPLAPSHLLPGTSGRLKVDQERNTWQF